MSERDWPAFWEAALHALAEATEQASGAPDVESALRHLTAATRAVLGDREAHLRPGGLRPGEQQFTVSGIFLVTPDGQHNLLVAEHGFPPEQHRLRVSSDLAHPGWVVKHRRPLLLANTDDDPDFKQILKTSRMGSALYAPMSWRGELLGQLVTASQARHTYSPPDLDVMIGFARVAAAVYVAHGGPRFLRTIA
jgi:GAF domain-containing protein